MKKRIVILGTGSNSLEIAEMAQLPAFASLEVAGFLADGLEIGTKVHGIPVLGGLGDAQQIDDVYFVNGIGSSGNYASRHEFIRKTGISDERFMTLVHPSASVSPSAELKHGVVLFQNVVIGMKAVIGNHVIALPQTTVSHNTLVGDHACLATGVILSGSCVVGESCYLGAGCVTRERTQIGSGSLVGAGSVVIDNIAPQTVAAGNPARPLRPSHNV